MIWREFPPYSHPFASPPSLGMYCARIDVCILSRHRFVLGRKIRAARSRAVGKCGSPAGPIEARCCSCVISNYKIAIFRSYCVVGLHRSAARLARGGAAASCKFLAKTGGREARRVAEGRSGDPADPANTSRAPGSGAGRRCGRGVPPPDGPGGCRICRARGNR